MTPILEFYPLIPSMGSPYRTGDALFDLPAEYKRTASLIGDLLFQAPRRLVLREGPKDFGTPNWAYVFTERGESDDRRMGGMLAVSFESDPRIFAKRILMTCSATRNRRLVLVWSSDFKAC